MGGGGGGDGPTCEQLGRVGPHELVEVALLAQVGAAGLHPVDVAQQRVDLTVHHGMGQAQVSQPVTPRTGRPLLPQSCAPHPLCPSTLIG